MTESDISGATFDHWRFDRTAAMTLVDLCHGGALYYYHLPNACSVWVFTDGNALLVTYSFQASSPEGIRREIKALLDALRRDPGGPPAGRRLGLAALREPGGAAVRTACFHPGDWCGLSHGDLVPQWDQLPPAWPEPERARIASLVDERIRMALACGESHQIYPTARALFALKKFALAESVFRHILALEEATGHATNKASATQSLGALAAHQQRYDEATALIERAIQLWIAACGPSDPRVASAREMLERVAQHANGASGRLSGGRAVQPGEAGISTGQQAVSEPAWVDRGGNRFGIELLDLGSSASGSTAWTTRKDIVETFARLRRSGGAEYVNRLPDDPLEFDSALRYPYSGEHQEGPVFKARVMEDKWDLYLYGARLYAARSWDGTLCFAADCELKRDHVDVRRIVAAGKYVFGDAQYAGRVLDFLIKSHMSNMAVPHPLPSCMRDASPRELAAHSFEMFGRRGLFASFEETIGLTG